MDAPLDNSAVNNLPAWIQFLLVWLHSQPFLGILLIVTLMDFISGVILAAITKKVSSSVAWRGMARKVMTLLLVGLAAVLEPLTHGVPLMNLVCVAFIATEGLSILENAAAIGVPIPQSLIDVLQKLREDKATRYSNPSPPVQPAPPITVNIVSDSSTPPTQNQNPK